MVVDRTRGVYNLCLLCNLAIVAGVYGAWVLAYNARIPFSDAAVREYLFCLEFLLVGLVVGFRSGKANDDVIGPRWTLANQRSMRQVGAGLFALFVAVTGFQLLIVSRLFLFSLIPPLYVTLLVCNRYLPGIIAKRLYRAEGEERIVLLGSVARAANLRQWLDRKRIIGLRTVGILSDDPLAATDDGYPYLGGTEALERVLSQQRITQVLLAEMPAQSKILHQYIHICERAAVRLLTVSDVEERFQHTVTIFADEGRRFISLRDEPLQDPMNRAAKRLLDLAVSLPVTLLILPPVTALVWLLQRSQSPGPVFFVQQRVGMGNQTFRIIKYRTMTPLVEAEARQATKADDRTFPAGRWLRRLSIDELPQFLNVLRGDMSVVGPRPHLSQHNELFARALNNFHVRSQVKPGITGLAQVRGYRGEIKEEKDILERVNADIYYLEHWSLPLDCFIILKTADQVLRPPERAY